MPASHGTLDLNARDVFTSPDGNDSSFGLLLPARRFLRSSKRSREEKGVAQIGMRATLVGKGFEDSLFNIENDFVIPRR